MPDKATFDKVVAVLARSDADREYVYSLYDTALDNYQSLFLAECSNDYWARQVNSLLSIGVRTQSACYLGATVIPGPLQIPQYSSKKMFSFFGWHRPNSIVDKEIVAGALSVRRSILRCAIANPDHFCFIIWEPVLRAMTLPAQLHVEQLCYIKSLITNHGVRIGILPSHCSTSHNHTAAVLSSFIIRDGLTVEMETYHGDIILSQPAQISEYQLRYSEYASVALFGEESVKVLEVLESEFRALSEREGKRLEHQMMQLN
jgi:hypothetical protein